MRLRHAALAVSVHLALVCAAAPAARADDAPDDQAASSLDADRDGRVDPDELDAVVVTGRAGVAERSRVETSYAVTTIDEEQLRMDAPLGVADALKSVPGFWVEPSGGEASANIRARGIPQEGFSAVGMLEDGLPLQHDPGLGWLNADQSFRLDETIERFEVVRGGPASIFSSNAPGGVVNFITRRGADYPQGLLKYQIGDYGLHRLDGWYGAPLGDWRFGVGGFYRVDDGVRDPGYTANEGGQLRVSLGRDFERGAIDFNLKHIDDNVVFYTGIPLTRDQDGDIVGVPGIDANYGTLAGPETERLTLRDADGERVLDAGRGTDIKLTQFTAQLGYELTDEWRIENGLRYRDSETARVGLFPNTPVTAQSRLDSVRATALAMFPGATDVQLRYLNSGEVFDVQHQNGNGLIADGSLRQVDVVLDEWINDFRLLRQFDTGGQTHDLALGFYVAGIDEEFRRYSANSLIDVRDNARLLDIVAVDADGNVVGTLTDGGITRYGSEFANGQGESTTYAFYASDEWQISDAFRLDLGARWERIDVEGTTERTGTVNLGDPNTVADDNVLAGTGVFDDFDTDFDDVGWTVGGNWQFSQNSGLFARYTSTFRLPSVGSFITSPTAQPVIQTMDFIEGGYKFAGDTLDFYATGFRTKFDNFGFNELVFNPGTGGYDSRTAYTSTTTVGVELEGFWFPNDWFDLRFSATWQDPEFDDLTNSRLVDGQLVVDDYSGNQLVRVPKVSYRVTPAVNLVDNRLRLELDFEHYGDRYADAANSVELPDYDVINANARFELNDSIALYFNADNLTNEVGLTEGNPRAGQFQSGEADSVYFVGRPILGRSYRASILWRF